jgi:hypothetical protein
MFSKKKNIISVFVAVLLASYFCIGCTVTTSDTDDVTTVPVRETAETLLVIEETVHVEEETKPEETEPVKELIDAPITFSEVEYQVFYDIDLSNDYLVEVNDCIKILVGAINSDEYTSCATQVMNAELNRLYDIRARIESDTVVYASWEQEHYYAAKVYEFLCKNGYSDVVACGIIGNMMIETSGGTLDLMPFIYDPLGEFYGLCQWSLFYQPRVAGMTFEDQLEYLYNDMEKEFRTFGFCYKDGFTYEDFLAMEDTGEAAIAFAKIYERCGSGTYNLRRQAAIEAYNYFVLGE